MPLNKIYRNILSIIMIRKQFCKPRKQQSLHGSAITSRLRHSVFRKKPKNSIVIGISNALIFPYLQRNSSENKRCTETHLVSRQKVRMGLGFSLRLAGMGRPRRLHRPRERFRYRLQSGIPSWVLAWLAHWINSGAVLDLPVERRTALVEMAEKITPAASPFRSPHPCRSAPRNRR